MLAPCWTTDVNAGQQAWRRPLLMLCIQCKKMHTVWVRSPRRWRHVQDRGGCLCEAQGLLLCADND
jgi:hypothetical protein